ncbi:MAG: hypothetical protein H3C34_26220, partial [Caldilineaceae bacterium]|nr:hypothetical protein [Caldilineaceae bacterium]
PAQGAAANIPRWRGETFASPQQPASVIGPIALGVSFDESGNGSVLGLTSDQLAALTGGVNPVALDANTLALLKSLAVETLVLKTTPGGLSVSLNGQPLPGVAYDGNYISRTSALLSALTGDAVRMETLEGLLPQLTNMDATITLDFTGQPAEFQLAEIPVAVTESGALTVFGLDIPGAALPADTLQLLADANIQQVWVNASKESINLAVNGQALPQINLSPAGLNVVANLVGTQAGISPQLVTTGVDALLKDGLSTTISLPGASGEAAAPGEPSFAPADLGDMAPPVIRAKVGVKNGQIASVGDLTADQLAALGVALPALPPNVMQILGDLNAKQVDIVSQPNALQINVNAEQVASIKYDQTSLQAAYGVAKPFLKGTLLENPGLSQLIEDQILPLVPAADINVQITIE